MIKIRSILISSALGLLISCAQQVDPTGGPKDITPPKIVESSPKNFTTGFNGDHISLKFNEFVHQNNLFNEIIISPDFDEKPDIRFRGHTMEMSIPSTLEPNTTYIINFGKGIADITENNPLDSNLFIFSTGTSLDSLSLGGVVKNAFDLKPVEDVLVMLYKDTLDSLPYKQKPYYFTRTDKTGAWKLSYLKSGNYKLFALKDANMDYIYNMPDEAIAFSSQIVYPGGSDSIKLFLFNEDKEQQYFKKTDVPFFGQILFIFNKPVKNSYVVPLNIDTSDLFVPELFTVRDTLCLWLKKNLQNDTISFLIYIDSMLIDTSTIIIPDKNEKSKARKKRKDKNDKLQMKSNIYQKKINVFDPLKLKFSHPVKSYDMSGVLIIEGPDTVEFVSTFTDSVHRRMSVNYNRDEGKNYRLFIPPGTFTDMFGLKNDSIDITFSTRTAEEYGLLKLKIVSKDTSGWYIIQLLNSNDKLVSENHVQRGNLSLSFEHLIPGAYRIKLIYDANNNSKWDTGNYLKHIQPENVIYYSGKVNIRGNWEQEINWILN